MSSLSLQFPNLNKDSTKDSSNVFNKNLRPPLLVNPNNIAYQPESVQIAAGYVPDESYYLSGKPASIAGEVADAKNKYEAWEAKKPASYTEKYEKEIKSLLSDLSGMSFDYDPESDPVFRLSRDESIRRGLLAMEDAMGRAMATSGGYSNSYAASAGQQAFANETSGITEIIPELYEAAYDRYESERDSLSESIKLLSSLEDKEFSRYADMMKQYFDEGELLFDNYSTLSKEEYDRYIDYANLMLKASK